MNRAFNFRSHAALGPQTTKYVLAIAVNYAAFVLGVGDALTAVGVEYQLARILSGLCEGVYMYCVMRWVVFRDAPHDLRSGQPGRAGGAWLLMVVPWGLVTWLVPSGWAVRVQPSWCRRTWWCHQQ